MTGVKSVFAIAFVLVSVLFLVVTGSIVLAITPGFRWTIGNVVIFVVGAFPGMFVLPNLGSRTSVTTVPEMYVLAIVGALIAGTTLVWVKTRLMKMFKK